MSLDPHVRPLVFTDLDGTLLDHDTYDAGPAARALNALRRRRVPLIFNSSKTPAEIIRLRAVLNNTHPFIAENGSVVTVPDGYFRTIDLSDKGFLRQGALWINRLGGRRESLLDRIHGLRKEKGYGFTGFEDMTVRQLADLTGLSDDQAKLAKQRASTEPILWEDTTQKWHDFRKDLGRMGLAHVQGGRFISISRPFDKKDGVTCLIHLYAPSGTRRPPTIGLGDSPNDQAMLNLMDIAVIIKSGRSEQMGIDGPTTIIRTRNTGPRGWQEAMDRIFQFPDTPTSP